MSEYVDNYNPNKEPDFVRETLDKDSLMLSQYDNNEVTYKNKINISRRKFLLGTLLLSMSSLIPAISASNPNVSITRADEKALSLVPEDIETNTIALKQYLNVVRQKLVNPNWVYKQITLEQDPKQYPYTISAGLSLSKSDNNCGPASFVTALNLLRQFYPLASDSNNMLIEDAIRLFTHKDKENPYINPITNKPSKFLQWNGTMYPYDLMKAFELFTKFHTTPIIGAWVEYNQPYHDPYMLSSTKLIKTLPKMMDVLSQGGLLIFHLLKYNYGHFVVVTDIEVNLDDSITIFVADTFGNLVQGHRKGIVGPVNILKYTDRGFGGTGVMSAFGVYPTDQILIETIESQMKQRVLEF